MKNQNFSASAIIFNRLVFSASPREVHNVEPPIRLVKANSSARHLSRFRFATLIHQIRNRFRQTRQNRASDR